MQSKSVTELQISYMGLFDIDFCVVHSRYYTPGVHLAIADVGAVCEAIIALSNWLVRFFNENYKTKQTFHVRTRSQVSEQYRSENLWLLYRITFIGLE